MVPTHFEKHRRNLRFFPWWMFSKFHCLKTCTETMRRHCHNSLKTYPFLLFWIATMSTQLTPFFGQTKLFIKMVQRLKKCLRVFENAIFTLLHALGFLNVASRFVYFDDRILTHDCKVCITHVKKNILYTLFKSVVIQVLHTKCQTT